MNGLFNKTTIEKIKNVRKMFLWAAVCILIGEVAVGAILILMQSFDEVIGKLMATFALCALVLFIGVNNFSLMEKEKKWVQCISLVGFISNLIWLVLSILFIWEIMPFIEKRGDLNVLARVMGVAIDFAILCLVLSNVCAVKETVKPVKPLKITATICGLYCGLYVFLLLWMNPEDISKIEPRWHALAGLAWFALIVMASATMIVSRVGKKKNDGGVSLGGESLEMQAKIRKMVEDEVKERMMAEGMKVEQGVEVPLQSEDSVEQVTEASLHDGGVPDQEKASSSQSDEASLLMNEVNAQEGVNSGPKTGNFQE